MAFFSIKPIYDKVKHATSLSEEDLKDPKKAETLDMIIANRNKFTPYRVLEAKWNPKNYDFSDWRNFAQKRHDAMKGTRWQDDLIIPGPEDLATLGMSKLLFPLKVAKKGLRFLKASGATAPSAAVEAAGDNQSTLEAIGKGVGYAGLGGAADAAGRKLLSSKKMDKAVDTLIKVHSKNVPLKKSYLQDMVDKRTKISTETTNAAKLAQKQLKENAVKFKGRLSGIVSNPKGQKIFSPESSSDLAVGINAQIGAIEKYKHTLDDEKITKRLDGLIDHLSTQLNNLNNNKFTLASANQTIDAINKVTNNIPKGKPLGDVLDSTAAMVRTQINSEVSFLDSVKILKESMEDIEKKSPKMFESLKESDEMKKMIVGSNVDFLEESAMRSGWIDSVPHEYKTGKGVLKKESNVISRGLKSKELSKEEASNLYNKILEEVNENYQDIEDMVVLSGSVSKLTKDKNIRGDAILREGAQSVARGTPYIGTGVLAIRMVVGNAYKKTISIPYNSALARSIIRKKLAKGDPSISKMLVPGMPEKAGARLHFGKAFQLHFPSKTIEIATRGEQEAKGAGSNGIEYGEDTDNNDVKIEYGEK